MSTEKTITLERQRVAIDEVTRRWLERQHVFFVGTAPLAADGRINISPKGLDTFRVLDELTVAYLDLTGSGIETIAHVRENGRIVVMFVAFEGRPQIVRLHGIARVVEPVDSEWAELRAGFPAEHNSDRAIVVVAVERVAHSCGFSIPLMEFKDDRRTLEKGWTKHDPVTYQSRHNIRSIDELPGLRSVGGSFVPGGTNEPEPPADAIDEQRAGAFPTFELPAGEPELDLETNRFWICWQSGGGWPVRLEHMRLAGDDGPTVEPDRALFLTIGHGTARARVGPDVRDVGPGDWLHVPAGEAHAFELTSSELRLWRLSVSTSPDEPAQGSVPAFTLSYSLLTEDMPPAGGKTDQTFWGFVEQGSGTLHAGREQPRGLEPGASFHVGEGSRFSIALESDELRVWFLELNEPAPPAA